MIWVSIILGILEAMPQLITLFQELWGSVHNRPAQFHELTSILLKHQNMSVGSSDDAKAAVEADLRAFHAKHVTGDTAA